MEYKVLDDQQIVEEYFNLATGQTTKNCSWLYGMVATYGLTPNQLKGFIWNKDYSIKLKDKKRSIKPLHPQWTVLFNLKKKQSCKEQDCFKYNEFKIKELIQAHKIRKNFYRKSKLKQASPFPVVAA